MIRIAEQSSASSAGGIWFVFPLGDDRVALWISAAGTGRVFVNGALRAEQPWLRNDWRYTFEHRGVPHEIVLRVRSTARVECECTLLRDGEVLDVLATARLRPRTPWSTPVLLAGGIALGYLYRAWSLSGWQLALGLLVLAFLGRRLQPRAEHVVGSPATVAARKHAVKWRSGRRVPRLLRGFPRLGRNVWAGARLAFGLRVRPRDFRATLGQVFGLTALNLAPALLLEFLQVDPPRTFEVWGVMRYASLYLLFFALAALLAIWLRVQGRAVLLCVALLSAGVWSSLVVVLVESAAGVLFVIESVAAWYGFLGVIAAWTLFYAGRALLLASAASWRRVAVPVVAYVAISFAASLLIPRVSLWYTDYEQSASGATWTPVDVEGAYYRQGALLDAALAALAPQSAGESDVFFVGFAPYSRQDVFVREVDFVRGVVAERLGSASRSLLLVNHLDTLDTLALANPTNLARVLKEVGQRMDTREDVLFLYLTSHGSADGNLSMAFPQIMPNPLDAKTLRALLDESGIRWRIVVVSACYSGTFIDALRDEYTLVLTAAHAEKTSFGCSNDRDLTYFAEHLFAREWSPGEPLLEAFEEARNSLELRERAEGYAFSDPQRFVGERMAKKLPQLEARP